MFHVNLKFIGERFISITCLVFQGQALRERNDRLIEWEDAIDHLA